MKHLRTARTGLLAGAFVLLGALGCGGNLATVTGEVTYDSQPVGDGSITLTPADGKGPVVGGTIAAGKYTVTGVTPGPKIVKVEAYKKVNFASSSEEMMQRATEAKKRGDDSGPAHDGRFLPRTRVDDDGGAQSGADLYEAAYGLRPALELRRPARAFLRHGRRG